MTPAWQVCAGVHHGPRPLSRGFFSGSDDGSALCASHENGDRTRAATARHQRVAQEEAVCINRFKRIINATLQAGASAEPLNFNAAHLVCKYKGIKLTVTLKIPYQATLCKVKGIKQRTAIWCGKGQTSFIINPR